MLWAIWAVKLMSFFSSHPLAKEQMEAVESVLAELNVKHIPRLTVWNKVNSEDTILFIIDGL